MIYFICCVLFFSYALATENADAWSDWSKWLKQSGGNNSPQPYWQNQGNWKEWASKASGGGGNTSKYGTSGGGGGSPWSDTPSGGGNVPEPSKENFDDWRKWNMKQEKTYGDDWKNYGKWQNWVENQKKQGKHPDDNANFGDWQKWMSQSGQGGNGGWEKWVGGGEGNGAGGWEKYVGGAGANDAGNWEKYVNPGGTNAAEKSSDSEKSSDDLDEAFEQWIKKRSASKIDTEHEVTEETRHGRTSKEDKTTAHIETQDETESRAEHGHGKPKSKESASTSNEAGNFKDYIPSAYRNFGGGGGDSWKNFIPGSYGAAGGNYGAGAGAGGNYGAGNYGAGNFGAGNYGAAGGSFGGATPQTLVATPKPRDDSNGEDPDWRKYVPEAYRGSIPPESVLKAEREKELAQNQGHGAEPPETMTTIAPTKEQVASTYSFSVFNLAMVTFAVCLALGGCVYNQYKKRFEYEPLDDLDRLMLI